MNPCSSSGKLEEEEDEEEGASSLSAASASLDSLLLFFSSLPPLVEADFFISDTYKTRYELQESTNGAVAGRTVGAYLLQDGGFVQVRRLAAPEDFVFEVHR